MVEIYVVLVTNRMREITSVPLSLEDDIIAAAKKKIGQYVGGTLLTEELYKERFEVE